MKKIHFVLRAGVYPNRTGGMEIFNYYLINSIRNKYEISYSAYTQLNYDHIKYHKLYALRPSKVFEPLQLFFFLLFHRQIRTIVYSFSRDHWLAWKLYTIVSKILNVDYMVVIHLGQMPSISTKSSMISGFLKGAKAVVAVSSDIKRNYDSVYGINCRIIYPLVPFELSNLSKNDLRSYYSIPLDAFVVCMVGTIKKMKNPDSIITVLSMLNEKDINEIRPFVLFAGSGDMISQMKQLALKLGIGDRVKFVGNIPKEEVNKIYCLSDAYLIASDYEGTSVSLLEAMFNSKPIIAARAPGMVDMLTDGKDCLMFETRNVDELKECLLRIAKEEHLRNTLSSVARSTYIKKYNYREVIAQYEELF